MNNYSLLFIPVFIFIAISILPVSQHPSKNINFLVSFSILVKVILAIILFIEISQLFLTGLEGYIIGTLLFSVIRHSIPIGTEANHCFLS